MATPSNVPSLRSLAMSAIRVEPRGIVGHSQRLRRERAWLVSSGRLLRMPGNWTARNVAEFLGPGHLFRYLVKKMLTMRDYVKEMIKALAERTPGQLSLRPNYRLALEDPSGVQRVNGWTLSGPRGDNLGYAQGPRLRHADRFYSDLGFTHPDRLWEMFF
jgi:hypothetical protein